MTTLEDRVARLERQRAKDREHFEQLRTRIDHWENTLRSPWYKRLWWWLQGFRLSLPGRWYRAPWNTSASKYDPPEQGK